jgi:hypothetical protein
VDAGVNTGQFDAGVCKFDGVMERVSNNDINLVEKSLKTPLPPRPSCDEGYGVKGR